MGKLKKTEYSSQSNIGEYDKLFRNKNRINKVGRGISMKQEGCKCLERKQNGVQVILEFPRKPENEEDIKKEEKTKREVKEILSGILQEHLLKNSILIQKPEKGEAVHGRK